MDRSPDPAKDPNSVKKPHRPHSVRKLWNILRHPLHAERRYTSNDDNLLNAPISNIESSNWENKDQHSSFAIATSDAPSSLPLSSNPSQRLTRRKTLPVKASAHGCLDKVGSDLASIKTAVVDSALQADPANPTTARLAQPSRLERIKEVSRATKLEIVTAYYCGYILNGHDFVQGKLYITNEFILFQARKFDTVVRVKIEYPELLGVSLYTFNGIECGLTLVSMSQQFKFVYFSNARLAKLTIEKAVAHSQTSIQQHKLKDLNCYTDVDDGTTNQYDFLFPDKSKATWHYRAVFESSPPPPSLTVNSPSLSLATESQCGCIKHFNTLLSATLPSTPVALANLLLLQKSAFRCVTNLSLGMTEISRTEIDYQSDFPHFQLFFSINGLLSSSELSTTGEANFYILKHTADSISIQIHCKLPNVPLGNHFIVLFRWCFNAIGASPTESNHSGTKILIGMDVVADDKKAMVGQMKNLIEARFASWFRRMIELARLRLENNQAARRHPSGPQNCSSLQHILSLQIKERVRELMMHRAVLNLTLHSHYSIMKWANMAVIAIFLYVLYTFVYKGNLYGPFAHYSRGLELHYVDNEGIYQSLLRPNIEEWSLHALNWSTGLVKIRNKLNRLSKASKY